MLAVVPLTRICCACSQSKPASEFYRKTNGRLFPRCKECTARDKAKYWVASKGKISEQKIRADKIIQPSGLTRRREWTMWSRYGITAHEFSRRLRTQGHKCACCGGPFEKVCVDHDHATGKVRGLTCRRCNLMLGHALDNVEILQKAIRYLRKGV